MKIELSKPFIGMYTHGYTYRNKDNRKMVCLHNADRRKRTISYAAYVYSVHLGRVINLKVEAVNHINDDCSNDELDNLQLLSVNGNRLKAARKRGRARALIICPACSTHFSIPKDVSPAVRSRREKMVFCSKDCSLKFRSVSHTLPERIKVSKDSVVLVYRSHLPTVEERAVKIIYGTLESASKAIKKEEDSHKDYIASLPKHLQPTISPKKDSNVDVPKKDDFILNFLPVFKSSTKFK